MLEEKVRLRHGGPCQQPDNWVITHAQKSLGAHDVPGRSFLGEAVDGVLEALF